MNSLNAGSVIGIGATNMRLAMIGSDGSPGTIQKIGTPTTPEKFFTETARFFVTAHENGARWGVMGVPGPTAVQIISKHETKQYMRVTNIPALVKGFDPINEMSRADARFASLIDEGTFTYLTINDGDLAAQAAARLYGSSPTKTYNTIAALINGTGVGGAIVRRDMRFPDLSLFNPDAGLWEIGHTPHAIGMPHHTHETTISGSALEAITGRPTQELTPSNPIWKKVAEAISTQIIHLGLYAGADLVVISGSNGIHGYYEPEMRHLLETFATSLNPMADKLPRVIIVPREPRSFTDAYELYGARGAICSFVTAREINDHVQTAITIEATLQHY
jgi:predicted NBD/HSP70 family sugar kinase